MNTNVVTLTWSGARPDDLAPMIVGEARTLRFECGPIAGGNALTGFAIHACPDGPALGVPAIDGDAATVLAAAGEAGCFVLIAAATLSSGETFKGRVRLVVEACGEA